MTDDPWNRGPPPQPGGPGADESTQEIDVEALRQSRGIMGSVHDDPTVMAPARRPPKRGGRVRDDGLPPGDERARMDKVVTPAEPWSPSPNLMSTSTTTETPQADIVENERTARMSPMSDDNSLSISSDSIPVILSESSPENEILLASEADVESVDELDDGEAGLGAMRRVMMGELAASSYSASADLPPPSRGGPKDPAPSLIGTLPGHDVAQALRAMMGEVPDYEPIFGGSSMEATHDEEEQLRTRAGGIGPRAEGAYLRSPRGEATMTSPSGERGDRDRDRDPAADHHHLASDIGEVTPNFALPSRLDDERLPFLRAQEKDPNSYPNEQDDRSHLDDGDTQTRLPDAIPKTIGEDDRESKEDDALPAFSLDEEDESAWPPRDRDPWPPPPPARSSVTGPPTARVDLEPRRGPFFGSADEFGGAVTRRAPTTGPPPSGATLAGDPVIEESDAIDHLRVGDLERDALQRRDRDRDRDRDAAVIKSDIMESTAITRAIPEKAKEIARTTETTAVFDAPVPSLARRSTYDPSSELMKAGGALSSGDELSANFALVESGELESVSRDPPPSGNMHDIVDGELPRFTMASIPDMAVQGPAPEPAEPPSGWGARTGESEAPPQHDDGEEGSGSWVPPDGWAAGTASSPPEVAHTLQTDAPPEPIEPDELLDDDEIPTSAGAPLAAAAASQGRKAMDSIDVDVRISDPAISDRSRISEPAITPDLTGGGGGDAFSSSSSSSSSSPAIDPAFADEIREEPTAVGKTGSRPAFEETAPPPGQPGGLLDLRGVLGRNHDDDEEEELDDAEIEEIIPDEIVEEDQTSVGAPKGEPREQPPPPHRDQIREDAPVVFRRPAVVRASQPPAFAAAPDAEEMELAGEQRWEELIAIYRQRLADTESPTRKAQLLLKIASVYETGMNDLNEAFLALVDAFETQPSNEDVVTQIDRVGGETGRMGELAEKVRKKLVPNSPDEKRVIFLGHLVYWYEKVLSRGKEVSPLVSDIERHDKVHPVVLKRAAQIAGMNGDTKTQREHLLRALERTYRKEEKVALHLQLSSAFTGTPDALKHYQLALELDPSSIVALQGVKRLGKEKEQYAQVQWALERQVEVALTESERIDALLELAELQETKFLKRELAAELLERVVAIEPSQPQALKGLERCYHALRDWPKLARILGIRSEHTFEKKTKVELLELAAEVHESKLGDPSGAVELYRNILVVEPKHRRALTDLARLYEKLGDWPNVSTYKARLAELAPTKRASSQELLKLGDFLNHPDRDPNAAKLQYERAVEVDATNAAAWEALQKVAAAEGDDPKVIDCLENRKKHTDVPRQRAVVLVELANVYLSMNDEDSAHKCFEAAIRADSSNEVAAIAMLDSYTANEQWAEAAPLCELLVNAAIRDRDGEALFVRLRLATRIAAALGDADRAVTSAIAALDARPKDPGAQADLIAVCAQSPPALERSRAQLMRIAEDSESELVLEMVVRLANLMRDLGDLDMSASLFERARRENPEDKEIALQLSDAYLAQADYPRACKIKVDLARNAPTPEERFNLLVEAGEIWARRADELEKASTLFEEARAIKPMDPWLLQTLMWLYGELGEWAILSGVLEDIVQLSEKPDEKVKTLIAMANVVRDKLDDRVRAADLYDAVLDISKKRLDIFEELVRTLTEEKNWERLERSYRKMIARVKDDEEPELQFLLFHQLGLIYRDRLGDASRAYDALDAASRLRPEDGEIRKIVIELLVVTDNLDNAVARIRDEIERDAHNSQLYAELYELFLRQHVFDKAWCVVNVLCRMGGPTPEQRRFHEDYAPMPLDRVPGQIVEQAWRSHIFHADLESELTNLFSLMTPAVARLRFGQLRPEQRVGRPFTPTHSRMHDAIRMTFNNSSEILACNAPELLLGDPKGTTAFSPALAPFGSIMVCVPQVEAQSSSLIYLCGKRLAEQRPELAARAFFPSVPDLTSLLGTAIRVSRNEVARDAAGAALDASFAAILTPQERDGMRSIVLSATADGASLDVKKWSMNADLSSMRAGLLLCGDVEPARQSIQMDGAAASDVSAHEKIGELYKFAVSDLYSDLRGAIGVAVADT